MFDRAFQEVNVSKRSHLSLTRSLVSTVHLVSSSTKKQGKQQFTLPETNSQQKHLKKMGYFYNSIWYSLTGSISKKIHQKINVLVPQTWNMFGFRFQMIYIYIYTYISLKNWGVLFKWSILYNFQAEQKSPDPPSGTNAIWSRIPSHLLASSEPGYKFPLADNTATPPAGGHVFFCWESNFSRLIHVVEKTMVFLGYIFWKGESSRFLYF